MDLLSTAEAGRVAARGRKLLRRGMLTHRQLALLDCLLWSCRRPGQAWARVSYTRLCSLAHMARETIAAGLRRLVALGLIERRRERVLVAWGGSVASRQGVSRYRLCAAPATEFAPATVYQGREILVAARVTDAAAAAQRALAAVLARRWPGAAPAARPPS